MYNRYIDDLRYVDDGGGYDPLARIDTGDTVITRPQDDIDQVPVNQVTADKNNYELPPNEVILFSTDASRTFTGFAGARSGIVIFCNIGTQDGVIANDSASSTAENRVLTHTGANITINAKESVIMFYDFKNFRWRTVGFV